MNLENKYFSPETDTKIDWDKVDLIALGMLSMAREVAGVPFKITSNYRTPEHSEDVGGKRNDAHTETPCTAFDILCTDGYACLKIVTGLILGGFKRIGINQKNGHIHVDNSKNLPQNVMWVE